MNHSKILLAGACCAVIATLGCASKPSALDSYISSTAPSNLFASEVTTQNDGTASTRYPAPANANSNQLGRLQQRLKSNVESDRIVACEQLGRIAAQSDGELGPIEMLASVMKSDESMEVRMAATDALGALSGSGDKLSSMIPTEELPDATQERVSFLQRILR